MKLNISCFVLVIGFFVLLGACAKDGFWNQDGELPETAKGTIVGQLVNDDDNQPLKGIKILFERQTSAKGQKTFVDTVSTDAEGKFSYQIPFPNKVRLSIRDTGRYEKDEAFVEVLEQKEYNVTMNSHPRFGMTNIVASLVNQDGDLMEGLHVTLSVRESNNEAYSPVETLVTDAQGNVTYEGVAFPVNYKVELVENPLAYDLPVKEGKLTTKETVNLTLETEAKFSADDVRLIGKYFYTNELAKNANITISYKSLVDDDFSVPENVVLSNDGDVVLPDFVYPAEIKIMSNDQTVHPFSSVSLIVSDDNATTDILFNLFDSSPRFSLLTPSSNVADNTLEVLYEGDQIFTMELDSKGNIYAVTGAGMLVKITPDGQRSIVASGFTASWGIALQDDYTMYVIENSGVHTISKVVIDPGTGQGTVSLLSGIKGTSGTKDGSASEATYNRPADAVYDKSRNCIWVGEWSGSRIRKIDLNTNTVSTFKPGIGFYFGISLTADNKYLYLASHTNTNGIYKYDIEADKLYIVRSGITSPRHVVVTPNDKVYFINNGGRVINVITNETLVEAVANNTSNTVTTTSIVAGSSSANSSGNSPVVGYKGSANVPIFDSGDPGVTGLIYDSYRGRLYVSSYQNKKLYFIKLTATY